MICRELALVSVEQCIICQMHAENRKNEKLFECFFNAHTTRLAVKKGGKKEFEESVVQFMTKQHLGDPEKGIVRPWKFPEYMPNSDRIVKPSWTLERSRKMLDGLLAINEFAWDINEDIKTRTKNKTKNTNKRKKGKRKSLLTGYSSLMEDLNRHKPYEKDSEELMALATKCNLVFHQFVMLNGKENVTNYFHILGSGHTIYFIKKFGSLYRYSQQGWESMNFLIKHFYFHNTNHGGNCGRGKGLKSCNDHAKPIMRWAKRNYMWETGLGEHYFMEEKPRLKTAKEEKEGKVSDEEDDSDYEDYGDVDDVWDEDNFEVDWEIDH